MGCGSSTGTERSTTTTTTTGNEPKPAKNDTKPDLNTGSGTTGTSPFVNEAVQSHNKYRAMHGAPSMRAAQELIDYAQNYANEIARKDNMEHSKCKLPSGGSIGENLYCYWSSDSSATPTADMAVKAWYDEIKDYNFNEAGFSMGTGHFTQVVWKGSVELGMAWAKAAGGTTYVVANYRPAGNMMGDFDKNVMPKM